MDYRLLDVKARQRILQDKLFRAEAEHFELQTDLELAAAAGVENDQVHAARAQLGVLVTQVEALASRLKSLVPPEFNGNGGEEF